MNKTYSTSDLNLATTLLSLSYNLEQLDVADIKRVKFVFAFDDKIEGDIKKFWEKDLRIDARTLLENQRCLKNRIYNN